MENNYAKIFVGNVPFQCSEKEFRDFFSIFPGFINADIIHGRDFGFVTMESNEFAEKLIQRNDVVLMGRKLRFTEYKKDINKNSKFKKNYLFIKGIPKNMKRDEIRVIFEKYGEIGAYFINTNIHTGESKESAVVEIKNDNLFDKLIEMRSIITSEGYILELSRWRNKPKAKINTSTFKSKKDINVDPKEIYRIAFNAGVHVGRLEGLKMVKKSIITSIDNDL